MNAQVIDVGTNLTSSESARLRSCIEKSALPDETLRLRLDYVTTLDVSGLALLVRMRHLAAARRCQLVFVNPSPIVLAALQRYGLDRVLDFECDVELRDAFQFAGPV